MSQYQYIYVEHILQNRALYVRYMGGSGSMLK